jgi:hypothetical protein
MLLETFLERFSLFLFEPPLEMLHLVLFTFLQFYLITEYYMVSLIKTIIIPV